MQPHTRKDENIQASHGRDEAKRIKPRGLSLISRSRWPLLELRLQWVYRDSVQRKHVGVWCYNSYTSAWLVLKGWVRVTRKEGVAEARKGEWLVAPPGERLHQASEDCELLSIVFVARWVFGREFFPFSCAMVISETEVPALRVFGFRLASVAREFFPNARHELPKRSGPLFAHLRLEADFYTWYEALSGALEKRGIKPELIELDPRVEKAVQILNQIQPRTPDPLELAGQTGLSASHLDRLFRKELGITVHEYCHRHKLAAARSLLAVSGSQVKETAFRLGFLSSQHFSRWFRLGTGMTPSQCQAGANRFFPG